MQQTNLLLLFKINFNRRAFETNYLTFFKFFNKVYTFYYNISEVQMYFFERLWLVMIDHNGEILIILMIMFISGYHDRSKKYI